jgi:hypothetical protein
MCAMLGRAIFITCLLAYVANGHTLALRDGGDTIPARLIPFSILGFGTVTLDPFKEDFAAAGGYRWYVTPSPKGLISIYPVGTAWLALPIYAPVYLWLVCTHRGDHAALFAASEGTEKLAAAIFAAACVWALFYVLRRRTTPTMAALISLAFGLASEMFAVASQALWQHGPGALCLVLGILFATGKERGRDWLAAGFFFAFCACVRPPGVVFGLAAFAYVSSCRGWRPLAWFALGGSVPLAATLFYNLYYLGNPLGGYFFMRDILSAGMFFPGMAGLLFSPNRGLLFFTPIAIVGIAGLSVILRHPRRDPLMFALSLAAIGYCSIHAATLTWAAGWSFGPRYLVEIMPILAVDATFVKRRFATAEVALLSILLAWSLLVQVDGAVCYPRSNWNARLSPDLEASAWSFKHVMLWEDFQAWRGRPF